MKAALLALLVCLTAPARAGECMDRAADLQALIQCSKSEVVPVERKAETAFERLVERYRDDPERLSALRESKKAWDTYRDRQCSLEGQAQASRSAAQKSLELQRGLMSCVQRSFERRLADLEAL